MDSYYKNTQKTIQIALKKPFSPVAEVELTNLSGAML